MNALTDLFTLDRIALDNPAKNRTEVFAAVGQLFSKQAGLEADAVVGFLNARENLGSTALGAGINRMWSGSISHKMISIRH
jgi:PTS system nitrogen regulatory IIA component